MCLITAIRIRPAGPDDDAAIADLTRQASAAFTLYPAEDTAAASPFARPAERTLVLSFASRVLAVAGWSRPSAGDPLRAEISLLSVEAGFRRSGFGRRLLQALELDLRQAGFSGLSVAAPLDAMAFFVGAGYLPLRLQPVLARDGVSSHAAVLTRTL